MIQIILAIFVASSRMSDSAIFPFSPTLDYGTSIQTALPEIQARSQSTIVTKFSEDGVWITAMETPDGFENPVKIVYKFYTGKPFRIKNGKVQGLFAIEMTFSDTSMNNDNGKDEQYVSAYANFLGIKVHTKKGHIIYNNDFDDDLNSYGISYVDGIWRLVVKNGNVVEINFPSKYRILRGQLPKIIYRQRFSIHWPED